MLPITHEVCIVGSGPVGLTLANCLARSPLISSIAMIDRKIPTRPPLSATPNQRVFTINGPSLRILDTLGIQLTRFGVLQGIQVCSRESKAAMSWQEGSTKVVENDELVEALKKKVLESGKVEWFEDEIAGFSNQRHTACSISLAKRQIRSRLLVGSDGNKSKVKQIARIATHGWSYRQMAIVCALKIDPTLLNTRAHQIYYRSNTLAILPLWHDYVSIVWSLQLPEFHHLMGMSPQSFLGALNAVVALENAAHATESHFHTIPTLQSLCNERLAFPLSSLQSQAYTQHRLALIGDAAHTIHPMAGLGVNSGIFDSVFLANNILKNKKTGNDIGQHISLSSFESKSKAMNYANSAAMEMIKQIFSADCLPFNAVRKIGMDVLSEASFLKSVVSSNPLIETGPCEWETS